MQNFFFLIVPILFLYYEESVCPLILKYNKVYFVSSLITKPSLAPTHLVWTQMCLFYSPHDLYKITLMGKVIVFTREFCTL